MTSSIRRNENRAKSKKSVYNNRLCHCSSVLTQKPFILCSLVFYMFAICFTALCVFFIFFSFQSHGVCRFAFCTERSLSAAAIYLFIKLGWMEKRNSKGINVAKKRSKNNQNPFLLHRINANNPSVPPLSLTWAAYYSTYIFILYMSVCVHCSQLVNKKSFFFCSVLFSFVLFLSLCIWCAVSLSAH